MPDCQNYSRAGEGVCPTPAKTSFTMEEAARTAASLAGRPDPDGYYGCRCGGWHLTSRQSLDARIAAALGPSPTVKPHRRKARR